MNNDANDIVVMYVNYSQCEILLMFPSARSGTGT